ncbi:hypothetical protein JZ751_028673 [Albula glossodonta]|uniref:Interleukin-17 receptor D n=1 Tax=Albula glossodonta TaxID=121402 RepID=A0A8T2NIJ5_9TELE|nr:hypothetical protein JZ751_028673 [Albula glossodonta]
MSLQGNTICEYCRITREDVTKTLGMPTDDLFGSCVPWPCNFFLGVQTPNVCRHYVHAPYDVTVEFVDNDNPSHDTAVISWRPSLYGLSFLRGFQVSLQALGGGLRDCQLFLFHSNLSLSATQANRVYKSDPFQLALDSHFAVTVMALPLPFSHSQIKFTHAAQDSKACLDKNGLEQCQKDWYPSDIKVEQEGRDIVVTFNLAPPNLGINKYFSWCYGGGRRNYTGIKANPAVNKTHHSYRLNNLQPETNYSCELAADAVDAIRKMFSFHVQHVEEDVIKDHEDKAVLEEHSLVLLTKPNPPRLLICYSNTDGPAHVRAVMLLAAFMQQHMAIQVCLDLWEALSLVEEGTMSWLCSRMQESDFVLVVCSRGLQQQVERSALEDSDSDSWEGDTSLVAVSLIAEEMAQAKAKGQDLAKYMTATFEYSKESDVPAVLGLAARYSLMRDLPLLFSHIHGVELQRPGRSLQVEHISQEDYYKLPAGSALQWAIYEAGQE